MPERSVIYISSTDKALGLSNWLFGGLMRLGKLESNVFTSEELTNLRDKTTVELIDAEISKTGSFGHDYFHSNPAVSSDLILVMRYHLPAGPEFGRPLKIDQGGFWLIKDDYSRATTRPVMEPRP